MGLVIFFILLKMKFLGKIQKFGFMASYSITLRCYVSLAKPEKYE